MTRKSVVVILFGVTAVCALACCGLLNHHEIDAPPRGVREAAVWWQRTADTLPPDLLATYVAASEVHRRQGTSATYVQVRAYRTMIGGPSYEVRLPAPPPDGVLERMRGRLQGCDVTRSGLHCNLQ